MVCWGGRSKRCAVFVHHYLPGLLVPSRADSLRNLRAGGGPRAGLLPGPCYHPAAVLATFILVCRLFSTVYVKPARIYPSMTAFSQARAALQRGCPAVGCTMRIAPC